MKTATKRLLKTLTVTLAMVLSATSTVAAGETATRLSKDPVRACLDGDLTPSSLIAQFQASPGFLLKCGSPVSIGVLHIDDSHPIEPGSELDFQTCASRLFLEGAYRGPGNRKGLAVWDRDLGGGRTATGVYETETGNIVTIYTEFTISNNWGLCADA